MADPAGTFTDALELGFDSATIFGNQRSKRYALVIEDGKVKEAHVEPDNTGVNGMSLFLPIGCIWLTNELIVSAAEKVLA